MLWFLEVDEFWEEILKAKKNKQKGHEEEEIWDGEKELVSDEEFIGDSSFRCIWGSLDNIHNSF